VNKSLLAVLIGATLASTSAAKAADFNLINNDLPGVGLNNTTPAIPIGGNPGKTRGEQALIVYRFAMNMWGGVLQSNQKINVAASFRPLACTSTSGTLASAGTTFVVTGSPDGIQPSRAYGSALADAVFDIDLVNYFYGYVDYPDITSSFNGNLGQPGCLDGMSWYMGLDGKTPAGQTNLLNVVMHELGHGLGVQGFISQTTANNSYSAVDVYTANAYDNVLNKPFTAMTSAERLAATRTPGRTVWTGAEANRNAALVLNKRNTLRPTAPAAIAGKDYEVGYAAFGALATPATFTNRAMVLVDDGNSTANGGVGTTSDGCSALGASTTNTSTITYVNAAAVAGKIAVIDRGTCSFEYKAKIAQDNGAAAVIIVNTAAGVIDMARGAPITGVTIPTVMVSLADGNEIKANIASSAAGLVLSNLKAGADGAGRPRLYTPAVFAPGSTYSHFDTSLGPNALMEPFDTPEVQAQLNVDLTPGLFSDIGWKLNTGNGKIGTCDTSVDAVSDGGFVVGANVVAQFAVCKAQYPGNKAMYTKCMTDHGTSLRNRGLISSTQHMKIVQCASLN
jgi:hypothetical protein